MLNNKSILCL
uniref:Uncharacterized protein n=1 Tax=Arundo donax TaxID=35708 RepID=A0A0A9B2H8_ARUDO